VSRIDKRAYAEMYGPTRGDRVRLADTELWIEVEEDRTVYGDEVKFGGGKVIRDGMGQSQVVSSGSVDAVISNALKARLVVPCMVSRWRIRICFSARAW